MASRTRVYTPTSQPAQARVKADLHDIKMVEIREQASKAFDSFLAKYQANFSPVTSLDYKQVVEAQPGGVVPKSELQAEGLPRAIVLRL
jgi:hypothetical protein